MPKKNIKSKMKLPYQADPEGSRYAFVVPNNLSGQIFLNMAEEYLNTGTYKMLKRGRGKRAEHSRKAGRGSRAFDQDLPKKYAQRFCVYLDLKPSAPYKLQWKSASDDPSYVSELRHENYELKRMIEDLKNSMEEIESRKEGFRLKLASYELKARS